MIWQLVWTSAAERDLKSLDRVSANRIHRALNRFSETGQADIARIVNTTPPEWRIRAGNHRIIVRFFRDLREMHIIRIHRRDSAY